MIDFPILLKRHLTHNYYLGSLTGKLKCNY